MRLSTIASSALAGLALLYAPSAVAAFGAGGHEGPSTAAGHAEEDDLLASLAARIEASTVPRERADLARYARRRDPRGSSWWFEMEVRAALAAAEHCAAVRLCTEALEQPLEDADRATLLALRATALDEVAAGERAIADLVRAQRLDPARPELEQRLHARLAQVVQRLAAHRELREARRFAEARPDDAAANLRLGHALLAVDGPGDVNEAWSHFDIAADQDRAVFTTRDWLAAARCGERSDELFGAIRMLEALAETGNGPDTRAELERLRDAAESQQLGALGYLGYSGYVEDGGDSEPATKPEAIDARAFAERLAAWESDLALLEERQGTLLDPYWPLLGRVNGFEAELAALQERAAIEARRADAAELVRACEAYWADYRAHTELQAELRASVTGWWNWMAGLEPEHPFSALTERTWEVQSGVRGLSIFDVDDLVARAADSVDARLVLFDRERERDRARGELLGSLDRLTAVERSGRAIALLAGRPEDPDLLAVVGIAAVELDQMDEAVVPLHLALASPRPSVLADQVRTALATVAARADVLLAGARVALDADELDRARALVDRALVLAPTSARTWAFDAECAIRAGDIEHALESRRTATYLAPDDGVAVRAHLELALRRRELSEALELTALLLRSEPHDADAHWRRSQVLQLLDRRDAAVASRRTATDLGHPGGSLTDLTWQSGAKGGSIFEGVDWKAGQESFVRARVGWIPQVAVSAGVETGWATRPLAALTGDADLASIVEPLARLTGRDAEEWPGVAAYLAGEVALAIDRKDDARRWFEISVRDEGTPLRIAWLAARRVGMPWRLARGRAHLAIQVPFDEPTLRDALESARPGQTIELAPGSHGFDAPLRRGVRIVGSGAGVTRVQPNRSRSNDGAFEIAAAAPRGREASGGGRVLFEDLTFTGGYGGKDAGEALAGRLVVGTGSMSLVRCGIDDHVGIAVGVGCALELVDCDLSDANRAPIVATDGLVVLDGVIATHPLVVAGATEVLADRLTLRASAALGVRGTSACRVGSLLVHDVDGPALVVADGANARIERVVWRAMDGHTLASGSVAIEELVQVGAGEVGAGVACANYEALDFAASARTAEPVVVSDAKGLVSALDAGSAHILLEPGTYQIVPRTLAQDTVIAARSAPTTDGSGDSRFQNGRTLFGVRLEVRADRGDHVLAVPAGIDLVLENVQLGVAYGRPPDPGSELERLGATIGVDVSYPRYPLVRASGRVLLDDCGQVVQSANDRGAEQLVARLDGGARLFAFGLETGRGLSAAGNARATLADGGVEVLEVQHAASVELLGAGVLERIEVTGSAASVALDDLRPERIQLAAFRDGAVDPRSAVQRRRDGRDPIEVADGLVAAARERYLDGLASDADVDTWARAHASYGMAHLDARAFTIVDVQVREDSTADALLALIGRDPPRVRAVVAALFDRYLGSRLALAVYRRMDTDLYQRVVAENRALFELGEEASAAELDLYADWEQAILQGVATREDMEEGRWLGLDPIGYRAELARREQERLRLEAVADEAIASGDSARIKEALMAISLDRWLEYVVEDRDATLAEVEDALAVAGSSDQEYWLFQKQQAMERELRSAQSGGSWTSSYSNTGSSGYSGGGSSDFGNWVIQQNTWHRDFDNWMSDFQSSSYNSYQNTYSY